MLSVDDVLKHYKMEVFSEFGDEKRCLCPFHNDHNPSFDINSEGMWICRSHCGGGNLIQFVMKKENVDYATAELLLNNNFSLLINDRGGKLKNLIFEIRKNNDYNIEEVASSEFVNGFILSILRNISKLPTSKQDLLSDWIKVLIYIKSNKVIHGVDVYVDLFNEFVNDMTYIKGDR